MVTDFKKKQKIYPVINAFFLFLIGILVLAICVLLIIANMRISEKKRELNKQIFSLENQVIDIEKSNKNLEKGIAQSTDDNYMEKVAREELDMQKAGEKVVSFVFSKQETIQSEEQNISKKWFSWIGDTWQWFKSKF